MKKIRGVYFSELRSLRVGGEMIVDELGEKMKNGTSTGKIFHSFW